MKRFAGQHPILFSLLATALTLALMTLAFIIGELLSDLPNGRDIGEFIGKVLVAIVFLRILWRFDWLKGAGITHLGNWKSWLVLLIPLVYAVLSTTYPLTGTLIPNFSNPARTLSNSVKMIVFRTRFLR